MLQSQKSKDCSALIYPLLLGVLCLGGCRQLTKTEQIIVPVDSGTWVPGVVVIHDYDEDTGRFRGLLLQVDGDTLVFIDEKDVSGAILSSRNRMIELLSKEAAISRLLDSHPELIEEALKLLQQENEKLKLRTKKT